MTCTYLIGVDGGGTGTRVRLAHADGRECGRGDAAASGLGLGIAEAWQHIEQAIARAFEDAGLPQPPRAGLGLGLGLAGANVQALAERFLAADPGYARLALDSDAATTLRGAHEAPVGAVIALGTGSIGLARWADGRTREVGGWGFETGDEASGAWLGRHAVNHLEQVLDGRRGASAFSAALAERCGATRQALFTWMGGADAGRYARLAPLVLSHGPHDDTARELLLQAGAQVARMAEALDPAQGLPLALCGGLAEPLRPWLPPALQARARQPRHDSAWGALHLLKESLHHD
jgi:glucosamine kinase